MMTPQCVSLLLLLLLVCALFIAQTTGQPEGWRMTDRFQGFRFELHSSGGRGAEGQGEAALLQRVQAEADAFSCFGWAQLGPFHTVVGEARCSKARGPALLEKLKSLDDVSRADVLIYEDTKIRLHYSNFKILPAEKETCFLDPPHQCREFAREQAAETASPSNGKTEL